ncbi:MAG TPA: CHASE3 domain-containing protein [Chitinophagaceae bacterium]|nr:CHASE3 domain-containing protein [Chitinophagaceae bacterium]
MQILSSTRLLTAGLVLLTTTLLIVLYVSVYQAKKVRDTSEQVNATQLIIEHTQKLVMTALDNETGARGYIITGNEDFLDSLHNADLYLQSEIVQLKDLLGKNLEQQQLLDSLVKFIQLRILFSQDLIRAKREQPPDISKRMVENGAGKEHMDHIRMYGNKMEKSVIAMLALRKRNNEQSIQRLNYILYSVLAVVFIASLITIRKLHRDIRNREAGEKKFRALLDAAPDATIIADEKGIIRMINKQAEDLFDYSRNEMTGQPVEILVPANLHTVHVHHRNTFMKKASLRPMGAGLDLYAVKKGGIQFPVEISLSPIHSDEGLMVIASVRDITQRKQLENALRRSNAEMEAFTYSVSHDLRAPLRGIVGFTTILEEDYGDKLDDEGHRITGIIRSNTLRMGHLIDDLLAFSRLGRQELQKTEVMTGELVKDIIRELMLPEPSKPIQWTIAELPPVYADIKTLRQVWINLLSNAVKYCSKKDEPVITVGYKEENGEQLFFIRDNGVGFDNKYRDKLFRVFQRLHSEDEFEGTGVGLALVEKIISRHGGRVWAEGVVGEGACFYFSLPKG